MAPTHDWSIIALLKWVTSYFQSHHIDSPRATAEILLAHALECQRIDLYLNYDQPLSEKELADFKLLLKRRVQKEPVAYIVGHKEFWSMDFKVSPQVLIPRPDTECLVEATLTLLKDTVDQQPRQILELGTGSGAVITAIASTYGHHRYYGMDLAIEAVSLARENAHTHGFGQNIHFFAGNWLEALKSAVDFDVIISNPPYIPTTIIETLQPEVCRFEPFKALDGGESGLACISFIIGSVPSHLKPNGHLLLEIGHDQQAAVQTLFEANGNYKDIKFLKDYNGIERVVQAGRK